MLWIWIMLGGALGAGGRHAVAIITERWITEVFPLGTLVVNVVGSFGIGAAYVLLDASGRAGSADLLRAFLITGLLGGFTTFSAFSLQTLQLLESGQWGKGALNIILQFVLCLGACGLGLWLAKNFQFSSALNS